MLIQERPLATLSGFFSLLALVLTCVGLYGIMSYSVARRTNESGVRVALGAAYHDVLWLILRDSVVLLVIGVAVGLMAAQASTEGQAGSTRGALSRFCPRFRSVILSFAVVDEARVPNSSVGDTGRFRRLTLAPRLAYPAEEPGASGAWRPAILAE